MALQWVGLKILCLLFSLAVSPSMVLPVVVNGTMGASVTLPCEGSAYSHSSTPDVLWKTSDGVIVADFLQDIDNIYFKDRVKFNREGIKTRNFSITINPTFLSDEDNYKCVCRNCKKTILANVHLTVCAPPLKKSVSASIGDSVTLPCFSHVNRQTARDKLFVQWKRGDKLVLELSSGMFKYGGEFNERRVDAPLERIQQGNFSLTLKKIGLSDQGDYLCYNDKNQTVGPIVLEIKGDVTRIFFTSHAFSLLPFCILLFVICPHLISCKKHPGKKTSNHHQVDSVESLLPK